MSARGRDGALRLPRAACAVALALAAACATLPARADPSDPNEASASDADYSAGRAAVVQRRWAEAISALQKAAVRFPDDADLQNDLGYAYRNLGQFEPAFRHYKRALALDPRHRGAHEYIGEAYLLVDDLPGAERHLAALGEICLLPCEQQDDLRKAVAAYKARKGAR